MRASPTDSSPEKSKFFPGKCILPLEKTDEIVYNMHGLVSVHIFALFCGLEARDLPLALFLLHMKKMRPRRFERKDYF